MATLLWVLAIVNLFSKYTLGIWFSDVYTKPEYYFMKIHLLGLGNMSPSLTKLKCPFTHVSKLNSWLSNSSIYAEFLYTICFFLFLCWNFADVFYGGSRDVVFALSWRKLSSLGKSEKRWFPSQRCLKLFIEQLCIGCLCCCFLVPFINIFCGFLLMKLNCANTYLFPLKCILYCLSAKSPYEHMVFASYPPADCLFQSSSGPLAYWYHGILW